MPVDIDNTFNSAEDKVQYALGTMNAYSVIVENIYKNTIVSASSYPSIIALTYEDAFIKVLKWRSSIKSIKLNNQDQYTRVVYQASLCE